MGEDGLFARLMRWVRRSKAPAPALVVAAILEASVLPIPVEIALLPMMIADRSRIWLYVAAVSVGNVLGALVLYALGWWVADPAGLGLVEALGWDRALADYQGFFEEHGFWAIFVVGVSPIPLQVALLTAGAASYDLGLFVLAVLLSRSLRYSVFGALVQLFGEQARSLWERNKILGGVALFGVAGALWGLSWVIRWAVGV